MAGDASVAESAEYEYVGGEKGDDPKGKGESYDDHAASPPTVPRHMREQQELFVEKELSKNSQQRREIPAGRLEEPKQKAPATPAAPKQMWAARPSRLETGLFEHPCENLERIYAGDRGRNHFGSPWCGPQS